MLMIYLFVKVDAHVFVLGDSVHCQRLLILETFWDLFVHLVVLSLYILFPSAL